MKPTRNLGFQLLGVWLIAHAVLSTITVPGIGLVMAVLALAAGLLILIGR